MTSTMTREQGQMFRAAYDGAVKRYSRMTKAQLRHEDDAACKDAGIEHVFGGPVSKEELLRDILDLRGYTITKLNEAIHASAHDVTWPDCEWCQTESCVHLDNAGRPYEPSGWAHASLHDDEREPPWLGDIDRRANDDIEFCVEGE